MLRPQTVPTKANNQIPYNIHYLSHFRWFRRTFKKFLLWIGDRFCAPRILGGSNGKINTALSQSPTDDKEHQRWCFRCFPPGALIHMVPTWITRDDSSQDISLMQSGLSQTGSVTPYHNFMCIWIWVVMVVADSSDWKKKSSKLIMMK